MNWIIKHLGGFTLSEYLEQERNLREELTKQYEAQLYRVGDPVYVQKHYYNPLEVHYILELFGSTAGPACYVSTKRDDKKRDLGNTVLIREISHKRPEVCKACQRPFVNQ